MANMPHPDMRNVHWKLHKDMLAALKAAAAAVGEPEIAFVRRALQAELDKSKTGAQSP